MPSVSVALTDHEDSLVDHLVASGEFPDADAVFQAGLQLVEERLAQSQLKSIREDD